MKNKKLTAVLFVMFFLFSIPSVFAGEKAEPQIKKLHGNIYKISVPDGEKLYHCIQGREVCGYGDFLDKGIDKLSVDLEKEGYEITDMVPVNSYFHEGSATTGYYVFVRSTKIR